jgi:hypothetical protein
MYHRLFIKNPPYKAFPTAANRADRTVSRLCPLPCQVLHGYWVATTGRWRDAHGPARTPPSGAAAAAPPAGDSMTNQLRVSGTCNCRFGTMVLYVGGDAAFYYILQLYIPNARFCRGA